MGTGTRAVQVASWPSLGAKLHISSVAAAAAAVAAAVTAAAVAAVTAAAVPAAAVAAAVAKLPRAGETLVAAAALQCKAGSISSPVQGW